MILKKGKNNSKQAVRALQYLLDLNADGVFGSDTKTAVKNFQKANELTADGVAGPNTLTVLAKSLPDVKYKDYSKSKYVKAVQSLVGSSIDGKYGSGTKANVLAFQLSASLIRSGDITQNDWLALWDCAYMKTDFSLKGTNSKEPVDYKQGDSRWKNIKYTITGSSKQTIGSSGCGPTSMADIMACWIDKNITPVEMCEYSLKKGFRTKNSGTAWDFYKSVAKDYPHGFSNFVQTKSLATLKKALADGAFAVASMGPGYWTSGGHFICVYKVSDGYIYAKDPASKTRKKQKLSAFEDQRKQFFIFYKKEA